MITDRQVKKLWKLLTGKLSLEKAAARCDMDEKTARKYRDAGKLPSELAQPHTWRTREDPFEEVWPQVYEQLEESPGLQAKTLFEWLQRQYPGRFQDGQLRTFQRGVKRWRATAGPPKEVFFSQVHQPGRLCASDFTHMTSLHVTIQGQPFEHLVYHFVLTYSNWETATICFSESFESLSDGLQQALWELGGVPQRHRTDRMSTAVNNLSKEKEFTKRYEGLLDHYSLVREKIQAGEAHENGDVESLHRHFKTAVDQALMLRGSRDFASREEYAAFLREVLDQKNVGRRERLAEELTVLRPLPARRRESYRRVRVRVGTGSLIQVDRNTYSVDSRLIGERVEVRICTEHLEVWYGQRLIERLPRQRGRGKHHINYRHIIDTLVRKPGAFENYRYCEELFPTSRFRMAYDLLCSTAPSTASRQYLEILHLAARQSESAVDDALRVLLDRNQAIGLAAVREFVHGEQEAPPLTDVTVAAVDLSLFDDLFTNKEVWDGGQHGCEGGVGRATATVASADVP
jgi:hypothetical protein